VVNKNVYSLNFRKSKLKRARGSRLAFIVFNTIFMILLSFLFLAPYINILAKSFNAAKDTMLGGLTFWPRKWSLDNYSVVLGDSTTWSGFRVSVLRVIIGSAFALFINYMAAYALLKKGLRFKKLIILIFTIPMFVSGGLISEYIWFPKFGIYNTFWVYILPSAFSFYNMVIIRTYLSGIPESLLESARLDGAGELTILFKIMLPLSMPIVATILLWSAVANWNDWTTTLYFVEDQDLFTLQYNMQIAIKQTETVQQMIANAIESGRPLGDIDTDITAESIQAAQLIVTTIPIIIVYPFLQRYFMSGVMIGSVKE
jgi:binding-protein-dependent transport system inner membrane component